MEGRVADEGPEVHGKGRVMTDQGGAGGMRKPGGAIGTTVLRGAEGEGEPRQSWQSGSSRRIQVARCRWHRRSRMLN